MRRISVALAVLVLFLPSVHGEDKKPAGLDAKTLRPFFDERTMGVLHVDLTQLHSGTLEKQIAYVIQFHPGAVEKPPKEWTDLVLKLKELGVTSVDVIASLADLPEQPPILVFQGGDPAKVSEALTESKVFPKHVFEARDKYVAGAAKKTLIRLQQEKPAERPDLERACAAVKPDLASLVLVAGPSARKIIEEVVPMLPEPLGGGSIKVLTRGLEWVVLRLDAADPLDLNLVAKAADHEIALELRLLAERGLKLLLKKELPPEGRRAVEKLSAMLTPEVVGDQLKVKIEGQALAGLRTNAQRVQAMNNLKQLGLAMHNYHDVNGRFPARASQDKQGKPLLSWRVQLLPFVEQGQLYREFHLDEPWDSAHNKKLIARMPRLFASPGNPKLAAEGKTTYLAPTGANTMFPDLKGLKVGDVTDGTSNTIFLVDAADDQAVIWTKPDDLKVDPKEPLKGLGFKYGETVPTLFVDGSVHALKKTIDKDTLRGLFTPDGGEVIQVP